MTQAQEALERASRHLVCSVPEADAAYGAAVASRVEDVDEWAYGAEVDLGDHFEVVWEGTADADLETLDRLAGEWPEPPEERVLLDIALSWGALAGERILEAVGGEWVYRKDPLHHSLHFPRKGIVFFPMHAVVARFLVGEAAGLEAGYRHLLEYLTEN